MTWLTSWPLKGQYHHQGPPQYAEHPTEAAAKAHVKELLASRRASYAVAYWVSDEEVAA